ncbi:uncharacterized protein PHALS_14349 [Plasmopara halstedii]|uniref:Uncharacterized protein n=1 Tax=Plasmopara halstedii TaxID=4781 RepID=A0A0P1AR50_PLAHL|nr:uncharacterized protein PHALS_14349 [Plasmopara halstedii]CEG44081.1 hypothetical protein PHALS_14349 [Plasmopara halstedii]|eukprot:XP_024580450.1 hypothetical protein PHALS_14349 [Plasmopara halstedii]
MGANTASGVAQRHGQSILEVGARHHVDCEFVLSPIRHPNLLSLSGDRQDIAACREDVVKYLPPASSLHLSSSSPMTGPKAMGQSSSFVSAISEDSGDPKLSTYDIYELRHGDQQGVANLTTVLACRYNVFLHGSGQLRLGLLSATESSVVEQSTEVSIAFSSTLHLYKGRNNETVASSDANANAIAKMDHQMSKATESLWAELRHVEMNGHAAMSALWTEAARRQAEN